MPAINYFPDPRGPTSPASRKYDCCDACVGPAAPSGINLIAIGAFGIEVHWTDNSTTEDGFDIRWRDITTGGTSGAFTNSPSVAANTVLSIITVVGPADGDTIEVSVRTSDAAGCDSAWVSSQVVVSGLN